MCVVFLNVLPVDFYVVIPIRPGLLMVEAKGMVHLMLKGTILFSATRVLYKIQKYVLHYYFILQHCFYRKNTSKLQLILLLC